MTIPGTEKVPMELPFVGRLTLRPDDPGWPGEVTLHQCPICSGLVTAEGAQPHADWHGAERMRNFGGF